MARIRSVHPEIFTDDAYMVASIAARLFFIGILCEALDDGVFKWNPLTLRAKIFPADSDIDPALLLKELEQLNFVKRFTSDGKEYGVVRNFMRYQSPRRPRYSGILPNDLRHYVRADAPRQATPESPQFPPMSEHVPTMTEHVPSKSARRGRRKGKGKQDREQDSEREQDREFSSHNTADESAFARGDLAEAVRLWNEKAEACDYSRVLELNDKRRKLLTADLKLCGGIEGWRKALGLIDKSSFLKGETAANYVISFDSIIKSQNFIKLMEGGFSDRKNNRSRNGGNGWHKRTSDYIGDYEQANGIVRDYGPDGGWSIEDGKPEPIDITPGGEADSGDREGPRVLPHKP